MNQSVSKPSVVAIIPARGGSKGIPRKNLVHLCDKPLVAWTIQAALASESVDRVIVSTDDAEIATVSQRFGAEVVMRPAEISGDFATSESALVHTLQELEQRENYRPDICTFLQCTAPLTTSRDIDGTIGDLIEEKADTAVTVSSFHYFLWRRDSSGEGVGIDHDKSVRLLRQQREPEYMETGAVYVMRVPGFLEHQHRFFGRTVLHEMPAERCWEIDDPVDLEVGEVLMRHRFEIEPERDLLKDVKAVVFDFDGVLTNNKVVVQQDGTESVVCDRSDGLGIELLAQSGLKMLVLSKERNPVVRTRCNKLNIPVLQGIDDKLASFEQWCSQQDVDIKQTVFVGNDMNDVECLQAAGCGVAVADSHQTARNAANLILKAPGGNGAVREIVDMILEQRGSLNDG